MTLTKLFVTTIAITLAAGCSYSSTSSTAPTSTHRLGGEHVCLDYGFSAGTDAYSRCALGETEARALSRVPANYNSMNLTLDAQNACHSYGLTSGGETYDRCVKREIEARRYREADVFTATSAIYPAPARQDDRK